MTMAVWKGYRGTGGKPAGNRENKRNPNQSEKSIYSTDETEIAVNGKAYSLMDKKI